MSFFKDKLKNIKGFIFDVDGVLSMDTTPLDKNGDPVRTANIKDGFAIRYAIQNGFQVAIITGANTPRVKHRYKKLGVAHIYMNSFDKIENLQNGYILVELDKKFGLLTLDGLSTIPLTYDKLVFDAEKNQYLALRKADWVNLSLK